MVLYNHKHSCFIREAEGEGNMGFFLLFLGILIAVACIQRESSYSNYMPPKGYEIDYQRQCIDMTCNGVSKAEMERRTVAGYYNVPCDELGITTKK